MSTDFYSVVDELRSVCVRVGVDQVAASLDGIGKFVYRHIWNIRADELASVAGALAITDTLAALCIAIRRDDVCSGTRRAALEAIDCNTTAYHLRELQSYIRTFNT